MTQNYNDVKRAIEEGHEISVREKPGKVHINEERKENTKKVRFKFSEKDRFEEIRDAMQATEVWTNKKTVE